MPAAPDSFHSWLAQQIKQALKRKGSGAPLVVWCDPDRIWRDLLLAAQDADKSFEVWADDLHELLLRERFYREPQKPRVVWLPRRREDITYFKVFELQACEVKEMSLEQALCSCGVDIPSDRIDEIRPQLPYLIKDGFDLSQSDLKKAILPPPQARSIDVLEILSAKGIPFEEMLPKDLFPIFARIVKIDYGLPEPALEDHDGWRENAVASLLCTDASAKYPHNPPSDAERIIPEGRACGKSQDLLSMWQKRIDLIDSFEDLVRRADRKTSLNHWASSLEDFSRPLSSRCAESALFKAECKRLSSLESFEDLAKHLDVKRPTYLQHAKSFWGQRAKNELQIRWSLLLEMSSIAALLYQNARAEQSWRTPTDAVSWFITSGWQVDQAGEALFKENSEIPSELLGVRYRLRKAYLRHLDRFNLAFSELISRSGMDSISLPFAGQILAETLKAAKEPVAVLILDAFRYDLGCRLAEMLNQGEPVKRADVLPAVAPIPSRTFLGMAFALPGLADKLHVELAGGSTWRLRAEGFDGDLTLASDRRRWLKANLNAKEKGLFEVKELLDRDSDSIKVKTLGKIIFVFDSLFDVEGHDGLLKLDGSDFNLSRYAQAVRRLRSGGYSTVVIVTDHGFFHWEPDKDEIELKPTGEILWTSRRAVCGQNLSHPSALHLKVTSSDIQCMIPRSINAFSTYGELGFFHGGTTLQEIIIPVLIARWPKKAQKIKVVLKPVNQIVSLSQRVEIAPGVSQRTLCGDLALDEKFLGRNVLVKVIDSVAGKMIFKSGPTDIEPAGESKTVELMKVEGAEAGIDSKLEMRLVDADDEEILDKIEVILKVELDEWF